MATVKTVKVTHDGQEYTVPMTGPHGDKTLHGSALETVLILSDPEKRKATDKLVNSVKVGKLDAWAFQCWTQATDAETVAFTTKKTARVRDLVNAALVQEARQESWHENRGGSVTVDVKLPNGTITPRVPLEFWENMLKTGAAKGCTLVERSKEKKPSK